jgi:putative transposase
MGAITYLKTTEGWMYLAIVMDLFSRRIVGWHIDKRMATDRFNLQGNDQSREPPAAAKRRGISQRPRFAVHQQRGLLEGYGIRSSMGDVGDCWDNAVVERIFGSLKHHCIFKVAQPTRDRMKADVAAYIKYYNLERLHTANGDVSPIHFEMSQKKVSGFA